MPNFDFAKPLLEAVAHGEVHVRVVAKLAEERVRVVAEEYVAADLHCQIVADLVIDVRTHIDVLI